jgi:hypothetical protein
MSRPDTLTGYQKLLRNKVSYITTIIEWCELASARPHQRDRQMGAGSKSRRAAPAELYAEGSGVCRGPGRVGGNNCDWAHHDIRPLSSPTFFF